ncbi:hypothetical protein BD310DRAFT_931381 [Dichomitus squalens]|uniref:Uncharacterized protein n=1 Tax=Dichomitus squalens TaxID=114155 RepID=A0A4Q9PQA7_9APHY|nr:hypothetical protein BD310DRAFT_931381 [Dichomitus squalens]
MLLAAARRGRETMAIMRAKAPGSIMLLEVWLAGFYRFSGRPVTPSPFPIPSASPSGTQSIRGVTGANLRSLSSCRLPRKPRESERKRITTSIMTIGSCLCGAAAGKTRRSRLRREKTERRAVISRCKWSPRSTSSCKRQCSTYTTPQPISQDGSNTSIGCPTNRRLGRFGVAVRAVL